MAHPALAAGDSRGVGESLTALLAAVELPLAAWACSCSWGLAGRSAGLGLTSTANSHSALASLGLGAVVGLMELPLLCSNRELAEFWIWDIRLRAIVVVALLAFPMLFGAPRLDPDAPDLLSDSTSGSAVLTVRRCNDEGRP